MSWGSCAQALHLFSFTEAACGLCRYHVCPNRFLGRGCIKQRLCAASSYDATSHFETTSLDVIDMYERITGEKLDLDKMADSAPDEDGPAATARQIKLRRHASRPMKHPGAKTREMSSFASASNVTVVSKRACASYTSLPGP